MAEETVSSNDVSLCHRESMEMMSACATTTFR